ncbi:MAG: iron complex outermembrane receptor protein [Arenicella sp.]|jgi:iron complex outermembrane receptor protein
MKLKIFNSKLAQLLGTSAMLALTVPGVANAQVEEIVVTAEKRSENIQDIGLSVTGINSDGLKKGGITDVTRVDLLVPGVNFAFIGNDAKINVRGANSNNTFGDNASIVGVFADGVYKPRASQQTRQFYDIERLEFLRGPQGTLYGRNTFAGAMNLYTNKPNFDGPSAGVDATFSSFNKFRTEAFVNVAANKDLALRFAATKQTSDGYVKNLVGRNLGADDKLGFRATALWNVSERTEVIARVSHADEGGTSLGVFSYGGICRPVNSAGLTDAAGGQLDCNNSRRGGVGTTPWNVLGPYTVEQDFVNETDLSEDNLTLEVNVDFDGFGLKSITSYTDYESLVGLDGDAGPNPFERFWFEENAESFTQEIQLTSDNDSKVSWTTGLYYSTDTVFFSFSDFRQTLDDRSGIGSVATIAADGSVINQPLFIASPLVSQNTSLNGHFADANEVESDYFGAYLQGEFAFSDQFRVIGGLRYNKEDKSVVGGSNFSAAAPVTVNPLFAAGASPAVIPSRPGSVFIYNLDVPGIASSSNSYDNVSWRAGFEFDLNEDVLFYGTASTGFLSGSVNARRDDTEEQESEVLEFGIKSQFLDNTLQLNAAAHMTDYTNLLAQLQTIDPNTGNVGTTTRNGGAIEAKGLEIELTWAPTPELTLGGNVAFLDSKYGDFGFGNLYQAYSGSLPVIGGTPVTINGQPSVLGGTIQLEGQTTPWSPDVTFNINGSYVFDLGDKGTVTPSFQMAYSDSYNVAGNLPIDPTGFQDSFTKTDFRLSWDSLDGDYSVQVFVENIEDEAVNARVNVGGNDFTQTSFLMPRNSGIRMSARF